MPDGSPWAPAVYGGSRIGGELSLREVAAMGEVSLATARRRWRDGELTGAYRDAHGHVRVPESAAAAVRKAKPNRPVGLAHSVVVDALWVLRRVLAFSRANGWCHLASIPPRTWWRRRLILRLLVRDARRANRVR